VRSASQAWRASDDHACQDRCGNWIDFSVCTGVMTRTAQISQSRIWHGRNIEFYSLMSYFFIAASKSFLDKGEE